VITNDANSGSFVEASFVSRKDRAQRMIFAPTVLQYSTMLSTELYSTVRRLLPIPMYRSEIEIPVYYRPLINIGKLP
jgi:hypothetical protein